MMPMWMVRVLSEVAVICAGGCSNLLEDLGDNSVVLFLCYHLDQQDHRLGHY